MKKTTKVYGIRNCVSCKGIVHGKAFRTKIGQRKRYFCNKTCVKNYLDKRVYTRKVLKCFKLSEKALEKATKDYIDAFLEPVVVVTK